MKLSSLLKRDIIPGKGVNEALKSPAGRKYLERLRKKYRRDLLRPGDPEWEKVWGADERRKQKRHKENVEKSLEMWQRHKELKVFDPNHPSLRVRIPYEEVERR